MSARSHTRSKRTERRRARSKLLRKVGVSSWERSPWAKGTPGRVRSLADVLDVDDLEHAG